MDAALPVLELQYVDETGTKGALTVKYPIGTTVATMDAQAIALASIVAPITGCVLIRQRIIYKAVANPRPMPETGSMVHRAGVIIFSAGDSVPLELINIPGIIDEVVTDEEPFAGVGIDLGNSDIADLISNILSSGLCTVFGDILIEPVAAYVQSRS